MKTINVNFPNQEGIMLAAQLEMPIDTPPYPFALFAHCFTCHKNLLAVKNISRALTAAGIAVLRFDFTGLGESDGDFTDTNFSSNVTDIMAASSFLEEAYQAPDLLIGHSLGGAAVLFAAEQIPSVKAVATIGAPASPAHVKHLLQDQVETINHTGNARVMIGGRSFMIKKQFLDNLKENKDQNIIKKIRKALLIMHSPHDQIVDIKNAAEIYTAAHHPKSFISLDKADHLLSDKADALYAGAVIASWAKRYIRIREKNLLTDKQVVVRTEAESYTTDILAGKHRLLADEPEHLGGKDLGPNPYELLIASLGACTSITLRMYANRKGWDLQEVKVHLEHTKDYDTDCRNCEDNNSKIDIITRDIQLEGNLDESQRQRLLEIADRCPVHKTLHSKVAVKTRLTD